VSHETVSRDVIPLHSTNLLTALDETGVIRYESPSIERILGFDPDELLGEQVVEYFHPDDRERVVAAFRRVTESEEYTVEAVEFRHERADGSYCWVESVASADPTPDGNYVVNTRDITERKRRERELERTNARLDELVRVVSHDLRSPLNVAQGRLALAREADDSEHLASAAKAVDRGLALVDDLLTLAHEGDDGCSFEAVSLAETVEGCWQTVETAGATLVVEAERTVHANPGKLKQLLENLIRNAVEHGSAGSRTPTESGDAVEHGSTGSQNAARSDDAVDHGGEDVTITVGDSEHGFYVADDGVGIPETRRAWAFESGHSTADGGTGLGLSIAEQIADGHGWTLRVTESDDGGARFEIDGVEREG
jgi:PAS domain S-box-containing protein